MMLDDLYAKIAAGGPLMAPIMVLSVIAWALILRKWVLLSFSTDPVRLLETLSPLLKRGEIREASALCARKRGPASRAARFLLDRLAGSGKEGRDGVLREAELRELPALSRTLPTVGVLAGAAPLLGLLGTVTGMIGTFEAITVYGTGNPRPLAEGISEALITTQAGLIVALPTLLAHNYLARRAERKRRAATDVLKRIILDMTYRETKK